MGNQKKIMYLIEGDWYEPIKMGDEGDWYADAAPDSSCGDCGAKMGEYHKDGCDIERCPKCGGQMLSCDCEPKMYAEVDKMPAPIDYKLAIKQRLEKEYAEYYDREMKKSPSEIYEDCGDNYFYREVFDYLMDDSNGFDQSAYKNLYVDGDGILSNMWYYFNKWDNFSVQNYCEIGIFVDEYLALMTDKNPIM